jgi:hypothetical protein
MICCGDSARFQRAGKCAGQSTGKPGDDVIHSRRQRLHFLFHAIKSRVTPVHPEMQWFLEAFDVRLAKWPFLLHQTDSRRMNNFTHVCLLVE